MGVKITNMYRSIYGLPNGIQMTDEGLMVACQVTDRVSLTKIDEPDRFGSTYLLREVSTEASNTSGLSAGGGAIWLGANGPGASRRGPRPTDAPAGEVVKSDPLTGKTLDRWKLPVPGGTHGLDYDNFEDDVIWVTSTGNQTLLKMKISDWSTLKTIDLPYTRPHGVARVEDGVWVVHTSDRVVVKFDVETGEEIARFEVPEPNPEPHGLSLYEDGFIYCDAVSGISPKLKPRSEDELYANDSTHGITGLRRGNLQGDRQLAGGPMQSGD